MCLTLSSVSNASHMKNMGYNFMLDHQMSTSAQSTAQIAHSLPPHTFFFFFYKLNQKEAYVTV